MVGVVILRKHGRKLYKVIDSIKFLFRPIVRHIKLTRVEMEWRKCNGHNYTHANSIFTLNKVSVGKQTYGLLNIYDYENSQEGLEIGSFCCIADNVTFILGGEHHPDYIMNYPFTFHMKGTDAIVDRRTKGKIVIEDDVWIGYGATILSGVKIGQGAVIAAGTVVTKDVPPYAVYTNRGIVKYRFDEDIVMTLRELDLSRVDYDMVAGNFSIFYSKCGNREKEELKKLLNR